VKRCPECNSFFPDAEQFCELDGTALVTVDDPHNPASIGAAPRSNSRQSVLVIGALACVLLGVLLVLVYFAMSRKTAPENSDTLSSTSGARQQESVALPPAPLVTASPSAEPSVEPSPSPSIETPSPQNSSAQLLSRSNPAAGAKGGSDPVVIRLHSGVTIEADEAWQTAEGIWYRKSGVVSLLDPNSIKAIEKVSPAAPQPSASTGTPSP
jgi:cytoskeletal protein RodZ